MAVRDPWTVIYNVLRKHLYIVHFSPVCTDSWKYGYVGEKY